MATGDSGGAKRTSTVPKSGMPQSLVNIQRMQNVLLIWLDNKIDNNNEDCRNTVTELRRVVNEVNTYTDGDQCIQFIDTITNNKVCMIISGSLGQLIVPRVHNMSQLDSIFIFCGNKACHEQWTKDVGYFRIRFEFFYLGFVPRLVPTLISLVPSRSR
jgi:hypothetical protein